MATSSNYSKLLINEPPMQVQPSLAVKVGLNGAIFLQQVHYWISRPGAHERDGRFWVYNSLPEWQEQFPFWSEDTIQRTIAGLQSKGVLVSGNYNAAKFDRTKWYTIDYEALDALEVTPPPRKTKRPSRESASASPQVAVTITAESGEHRRNMRRPIPETNAETTTETNYSERAPRPVDIPTEAPPATAIRDMPSTGRAIRPRPAKQIPLPNPYPLTEEMRVWAQMEAGDLGARVDSEHKKFCNHYWASAVTRATWRPMWENWMIRAVEEFAPKQKGSLSHGSHYQSADERKAERWQQWADVLRAGQADDDPDAEPRQNLRLIG
jgi:hypothetical protein